MLLYQTYCCILIFCSPLGLETATTFLDYMLVYLYQHNLHYMNYIVSSSSLVTCYTFPLQFLCLQPQLKCFSSFVNCNSFFCRIDRRGATIQKCVTYGTNPASDTWGLANRVPISTLGLEIQEYAVAESITTSRIKFNRLFPYFKKLKLFYAAVDIIFNVNGCNMIGI